MILVNSSNIACVDYRNGTLLVQFHSGAVYSYSGVPAIVYQGLLSAPSCGKYFAANIKNHYPYKKL